MAGKDTMGENEPGNTGLPPGDRELTYTYDAYADMLRRLRGNGHRFARYGDAIDEKDVLLRHDVDWSPKRALRMATLEAEEDVNSTYFFMLTSPFYNTLYRETREIIAEIEELGHDVGLHFSTHQYWPAADEPAAEELEETVLTEMDVLSTVTAEPVDTVSFHIPPDWVLKRSYERFRSTYEERFFTTIDYRGDSNQRWREEPPFDDGFPERLQILVHPGLWADEDQTFAERLADEREERFEAVSEFLDFQFIDDRVARN